MASGDQGTRVASVTQARGLLGFGHSSSVEKRVNWRYTLERNPQDELLGGERKEEQIHLSVLLVPRGLIYLLRWKSLGGSEVVAQDGVGKTKSLESHKAPNMPGASLEKRTERFGTTVPRA